MATSISNEVAALEQRASAAEANIVSLQSQLNNNNNNNNNNNSSEELEARLRELLTYLQEDKEECEAIRAQRDELKVENERLRTLVGKHEYRIQHLLRTINEIEGKQEK